MTIDPNNHERVWVGTGEAVGGRHVGFGDGIYVSHDGGQSFQSMGLKKSEHIAKIVVDPKNSNVVFVASQGPLWSSGGERGLYKSIDGGKNWELVLSAGKWTGATDVVLDPRNSQVVYAALHQRHRTVAALLNGGPESGIHKSTDGGKTWTELKSGLPGADKGKIALAVSPQKPDVVYATVELAGREGGFYRSENGGANWTKMSDYLSGGTGPHYYQEIWADPHRFDVVYHANVVLGRTENGGKTFESIGNRNKHVDNHAVAFSPIDPEFLLVGCDGGLYKSFDYGNTYDYTENLPLTQFYKVDVDYDSPVYHVVGGTQDNNTQYGPSRTLSNNGIRNADWRITIGGDGHDCAIDPKDPNIIYCESQQGYLRRFDRRTGESVDIRPQPEKGEDYFRFNWDSPIHISPHDNKRLYFGSKILHRSDDRGDSWTSVSGDLSRGMDRFHMKMMDRVWSIDAIWDLMAMSQFGNITSISESPVKEGLIYVGTDDGLIQVTEDGGKTWNKVDKIFGVPEYFFVNDIKADRFDENVAYACVDNHKTGDYKPYVLRSRDRGKTWELMNGDLPDRHLTWRIIQDHVQKDLLFLGTEFGLFVTVNGGENWIKMKGGAPNIPFRDLEIQRRENDLVAATFGRGFYVLDDYTPLRNITAALQAEKAMHIFPIKKAQLYIPQDRLGGRRGSQGDSYFVADNPPFGAVFTIYSKEAMKTKKQQRKAREAKNKKSGADNPYPGWDAMAEEDREKAPIYLLEIRDSGGSVVDRISAPVGKGLHRVAWGLRYAPLSGSASGGSFRGAAPFVVPGEYTVQAFRQTEIELVALSEAQSFQVEAIGDPSLPAQDRKDVLAFQMKVGKLQQAISAAGQMIGTAQQELDAIQSVVQDGRLLDLGLLKEVRVLERKLEAARISLFGDSTKERRFAIGAPSISRRVQNALFGTLRQTYGPTKTNRRQFEIAAEEFAAAESGVRTVLEKDMPALRDKLDAAGAPWTPGRKMPSFKK